MMPLGPGRWPRSINPQLPRQWAGQVEPARTQLLLTQLPRRLAIHRKARTLSVHGSPPGSLRRNIPRARGEQRQGWGRNCAEQMGGGDLPARA